jgi:integrase
MPLAHLNKAVIRQWQAKRLAAGRAPQTINNEHGTLALILDHAMELGAIDHNYAREVKRVAKGGLAPKAEPSADLIARLLGAIEPRYLIVLNLALYAGLRSGEARGLRIQDVTRLEDGTCALAIEGQITARGGARTTPKGRKSRTVYESGFVADLIEAHVAFYGTGADGEIVTTPRGTALSYSGWSNVFERAKVEAGVVLPKGQGAHLLRHAYASFAIEGGASPAEVAANLGHAQVSTTFAYYVHATQRRPVGGAAARSAIEAAAERIEAGR